MASKQQTGVGNRQSDSGFTLLEVMVAVAMALPTVGAERMAADLTRDEGHQLVAPMAVALEKD